LDNVLETTAGLSTVFSTIFCNEFIRDGLGLGEDRGDFEPNREFFASFSMMKTFWRLSSSPILE
jgi:hypothetical protein